MPLNQIPGRRAAPKPEEELALAVPVTAVLDSGIRKLAYVEKTNGRVCTGGDQAGPRAGDSYPVLSGLSEGDNVAVRGEFSARFSQFQIQGLPSLFYKEGPSGRLPGINMAGPLPKWRTPAPAATKSRPRRNTSPEP